MTPQLWHLKFVIFYLPILIFFFLLYSPIMKVSCVYRKRLKSLNLEIPIEGSPFWHQQISSDNSLLYLPNLKVFCAGLSA